jgi:hypothetical protein
MGIPLLHYSITPSLHHSIIQSFHHFYTLIPLTTKGRPSGYLYTLIPAIPFLKFILKARKQELINKLISYKFTTFVNNQKKQMKALFNNSSHKFIFLFSFLFLAIISTSGQDTILNIDSQLTDTNEPDNKAQSDIEYYKKDFIRNDNYIYKDNIKTVLLYRDGWEMTDPVIRLNSDEKLRLSFDDLDADVKNYNYTITHCDADWQTSDIRKSDDYINGFQQDYIDNYQSSFNTTRHYTHYDLIFPTDYLQITKSGNYILKVFTEDDSDKNIVFTWRFMVVEPKVSVKGKIKVPTSISDRDYKQEIDFSIFKQAYNISNPYGNLKVKIFQNSRTDNIYYMVPERKPQNLFSQFWSGTINMLRSFPFLNSKFRI